MKNKLWLNKLFLLLFAPTLLCLAACSKDPPPTVDETTAPPSDSITGDKTTEPAVTEAPALADKADIFYPDIFDTWSTGATCTSIIMIEHDEKYQGTMLCGFENWNMGLHPDICLPVYASTDGGATWKKRGAAVEQMDPSIYAYFNPCLYELPEQIGDMPKGTLLLAGCSVDKGQTRKSAISLYKSTNGGKSWKQISVCDTGKAPDFGVWEPYLITDGNGKLYCFYTSAAVDGYGSAVVYRTTENGVDWSELKVVFGAAKTPEDRTGMPVITKMGNGEYFMVYEYIPVVNGAKDNRVYCKTSTDLSDWGDPNDPGTMVRSTIRYMGSAPCCTWTPQGGDQGTLIVTAKFMSGNKYSDWFISHDYGKTFETMENPLKYSGKEKTGYRSSLFTTKDGTVIYASAVDWNEDPLAKENSKGKISYAAISFNGKEQK